MRRICCFLERWESGGIESFLYNVLTRIDLSQLRVDVTASSLGESVFTKPLQNLGICFFELSGSQHTVVENHRRFRLLARERHWDVLHLNAFQGLSLYYLHLAKEAGIPVRIAHSHNTGLRKSPTRPLKLAVHRWARRRYTVDATNLWTCSQDAAQFLFNRRELEQKGDTFIPNGIDVERFRFDLAVREAIRAELGLTDQFVIGNVGRLCYQKNQSFLLEVFAEVLRQRPESRLLLVGEGEDRLSLEQMARKLGVADKVIFFGVSDCIERLLWAMDVFVFPSRFEGLGIAAIEAQAAGLPVIVSGNVPKEAGITELFRPLSIESGPRTWADALLTAKSSRRQDAAAAVKDAGFEILDIALFIQTEFEGTAGRRRGLP